VHGGPEGQARPLWNPLTVALVAAGVHVAGRRASADGLGPRP
jgi:hypothetical protein